MNYPPRAELAMSPANLLAFERSGWIAQAKLNGSYAVIDIVDGEQTAYNRHKVKVNWPLPDLTGFISNGTICGEWLNKAQADETGTIPKYLGIHDITNFEGEYLNKLAYADRYSMILDVFTPKEGNYVLPVCEGLCVLENYEDYWTEIFNELTNVPLIEGLVIKNTKAKLKYGFSVNSNASWQYKFRKPTLNYKY